MRCAQFCVGCVNSFPGGQRLIEREGLPLPFDEASATGFAGLRHLSLVHHLASVERS